MIQSLGFPHELKFGLELEHDSSPEYNIDTLAAALYDRGYGSNAIAYGYHSSAGQALYSHYRGWVTEFDESVTGGEVISPVMTDNEETWETLKEVTQLIIDNGGTAHTTDSSCHIHFDTTLLSDDMEKWVFLYRYIHHFSAALYKVGTQKERGFHRGDKQCWIPVYKEHDNLADLLKYYSVSTYGLNSTYVRKTGIGHVEYRFNDASLDYETMREQVRIAGSLIVKAVEKKPVPTKSDVETLLDFVA